MDELKTCSRSNIRILHCSQTRDHQRKSFPEADVRTSRKRKLVDASSCHEPCHQTAQSPEPLAMSPTVYLSAALRNKGIPSRVSHLSLEQAIYFEPYREAQIPAKVLRALRSNDFNNLEGIEMEQLRRHRNSFGESLTHLVCRSGLPSAQFLIEQVKIPLNVRDKFGRSPLHNACLAAIPDFKTVQLVLKHSPKLVMFEDNKGRIPFDYISARNRSKWSRFLSEDGILAQLQTALKKEQKKEGSETIDKILRLSSSKKSLQRECSSGLVQKQKEPPQNPSVIDGEGRPNECIMKLFSRKPISFAPSLPTPKARVKARMAVQL
eukprot:CAMPEP_0113635278 /NCGR_PEP_ID=MMETSP0017_2-20120614/18394_1 /TAXON_ID=2856 /ORGANISM="Cylindrotheca closterium" /LENGTH=321 /DNA_ID=CAMNT_0000546061 /DNA_START=108 /DNA_END=1073 /DNA_ORIENTATION=- /assembly_acc=CAM_ASM_000147